MITKKQKLFGVIRLLRPQFLLAYLIVASGGIVVGFKQGFELTTESFAFYSYLPIIIAAMGVHLRDEAGDWISGYDREYGGMGVIREGIFSVKTVRTWGIVLIGIGFVIGILQAITYTIMFFIGIPMAIVIILANYLTEEVPLGHEAITASSYWGAFLWVYLAQKWPINLSVLLFSLFTYLMVLALVPYQDIGDYEVDLKRGKKTLVVRLGLDRTGFLCILIGLLGWIVLYFALLT